FFSVSIANAQNLLNKSMSLDINKQRLDMVLEIISNKGNFYFSYNSNILKRDSLVSFTANNQPVKSILTQLLGAGFEFRESGNYIILRRAPIQLKLVTSSTITEDKYYTISGYVIDEQTGERIKDASVYEKDHLAITNTNSQGYFKIKLKSKYQKASISVSKEYYEDTTVVIEPKHNQVITITLEPMVINEKTIIVGPAGYEAPSTINLEIPINDSTSWMYRYVKLDSQIVERTTIAKWFVSSKQKLQTINLRKFFVARPYQASLTPGLSTNGKLNGQVINNFSLNVFGGYSGGTNGFELGGLFNIDKTNVQYVQIGGLFNMVGGHVNGLQIGGITNTVLDSMRGVQIGGISNFVKRDMSGLQIGGVANVNTQNVNGLQIGGVTNIAAEEMNGVQIAGVVNYTKKLKGLQIGVINIADTSEGYSIGLINIILKGYHKLALYTNETITLNAAFKTGNSKLYSILLGGYNSVPHEKVWSFGYGLGSELTRGKRLTLNTELTCQHLYLGSWDYYNLLNRANLHLQYKFSKWFSVFAGPVYNVYVSNQDIHVPGYKQDIIPVHNNKFGSTVHGWFGWSAGINIF
ncbi:MAG: carboxypeptidase-like regulatory domain-containing protein, partial [Chitinophagaceae bacterium]|nr:carboxypeptidase-like regulatory domain-containing protein [Chitinophagaceae bacterium]